jgi:hypothetical protein
VFENSFKRVIARDRKFPPSFFTWSSFILSFTFLFS